MKQGGTWSVAESLTVHEDIKKHRGKCRKFKDGSITTRFEGKAFAAFDLFVLKRPGAEKDYETDRMNMARQYYETLNVSQRERLAQTVLLDLPGSPETYTLEERPTNAISSGPRTSHVP